MIGKIGKQALALAILGSAPLAGCSPAPQPNLAATAPVPAPMAAKPAKPRVFTLNTPVNRIAADPKGKAILDRDVPGVMASKEYPMFDDMSLSEIAALSHGRLTKDKLDMVQADLVQMSADGASVALNAPAP